jgi:peptidoglycan/xylan/chitin deacetylase (PgdA/CDA1 family)
VQSLHVCSAPVKNRRGTWLAATECFVEVRNLSKRSPLAQGQPAGVAGFARIQAVPALQVRKLPVRLGGMWFNMRLDMRYRIIIFVCLPIALLLGASIAQGEPADHLVREKQGAIIRGDVNAKKLALIFTGDEFAESAEPILNTLKQRQIKGAFFVTGNFARNDKFRPLLVRAIAEGHYVGPHSDSHPLYASWDERDKTLVTESFFKKDLQKNIAALAAIGAIKRDQPVFFIPPYEYYNSDQAKWSRELDVKLFNFTPGSGSNRDYMREDDKRFSNSQKIYDDILAYERKDPHGLNGFVLLLHLGSGRKDPFHTKLGALCDELKKRGYEFERVDRLLQ